MKKGDMQRFHLEKHTNTEKGNAKKQSQKLVSTNITKKMAAQKGPGNNPRKWIDL